MKRHIPVGTYDYATSLRMPIELRKRLRALALKEHAEGVERRSLNWIIVEILTKWVEWKESQNAQESSRQLAQDQAIESGQESA